MAHYKNATLATIAMSRTSHLERRPCGGELGLARELLVRQKPRSPRKSFHFSPSFVLGEFCSIESKLSTFNFLSYN